jgi:hypothetical protein
MVEPELWIGKTREREMFRVYVLGRKPAGKTTVWILGSAEARTEGLPGFPPQYDGFKTEREAQDFATRAFSNNRRLAEFVSHELNPLSLRRPDAPKLVARVQPDED